MKIYTKCGDDGTTSLCSGRRVPKSDMRVEAYGTLDELNADIGMLVSLIEDESFKGSCSSADNMLPFLQEIQKELFVIGGEIAYDKFHTSAILSVSHLTGKIEQVIDELSSQLPEQHHFILPGGTLSSAYGHICRTVCRRAERRIITLSEYIAIPSEIFSFINRLSDYFFILSRYLNNKRHNREKVWENTCR